jgi:transcriptional regulator EpsA
MTEPNLAPETALERLSITESALLNATGAARVVAVLNELLPVTTPAEFEAWTAGPLQELLPHGMMIAGIASVGAPRVQIQKVITHEWPSAYFESLIKPDGGFHSPIMERWQQSNTPQLYEPAVSGDTVPGIWTEVFHDFRLQNIAAHGVRDLSGFYSTYFTFSQIPVQLQRSHAHVLQLLTPHMHVALARALQDATPFRQANSEVLELTERERVILYWIGEGKTNWEIAQICDRSEHTIKHQVEALYRKLQVTNRAQASIKAANLHLRIDRPHKPDR